MFTQRAYLMLNERERNQKDQKILSEQNGKVKQTTTIVGRRALLSTLSFQFIVAFHYPYLTLCFRAGRRVGEF